MDVFSIIGPVMVGPSSSHTAGAVRIGNVARILLGREPVEADITFYGSFARTYRGHGTDKAILAGIMGLDTDDTRIRRSFEDAEDRGLSYRFRTGHGMEKHPNTAHIRLKDREGREAEMEGASVGGGSIVITQVNGLEVNFSGEFDTLIILHRDVPGVIAKVTTLLTEHEINICHIQLNRTQRGGDAVMTIETDDRISSTICGLIAGQNYILNCILCNKID